MKSMNLVGSRILITGGAGFIGSELTCQASVLGGSVTVVDNLVNGRRDNLTHLMCDRVKLVVCDIRDQTKMAALLRGIEIIFHLACLGVRHSIHSPSENHEVNATATLKLLIAAKKAGIRRFVHVSSSEVYGTARHVPMTEEHPTYPMTVYGASKLAGECYARAFHSTYGYSTVVVRPFNSYGPNCHHEGDSGEVIPKFLLRCMANEPVTVFGDGNQTRDFTYVTDTARGILLAGLADDAVGQTINLGSGREICINDLANAVGRTVGRSDVKKIHDDPRPGDVLRLCADIGTARRLLGFSPNVSLTEGLTRLRDWYENLHEPSKNLLKKEIIHNWKHEKLKSI